MTQSAEVKKIAAMITRMKTIIVVRPTSLRVGHVTLEVSDRTSCKNWKGLNFAIAAPARFEAQPLVRTKAGRRKRRFIGMRATNRICDQRQFSDKKINADRMAADAAKQYQKS
jgi:hypothetical protein